MDTELIKKCIDLLDEKSEVSFFIEEVKRGEDGKGSAANTVSKKFTERAHSRLKLTREYVYFVLEFENANNADLLGLKHSFEQYLNRNTNAILNDTGREYFLVADLVAFENGIAYKIEGVNPLACWQEKKSLMLCFTYDNVNYGTDDFDREKTEKDIEYEKKVAEGNFSD